MATVKANADDSAPIETKVSDLKRGDLIALAEGVGRVVKVETASHMPSIFQDCFGADGRSVYWHNVTGPHKGKPGVERAHKDTTVNVLRAVQS